MLIIAEQKNIRQATRKLRLVANTVKSMDIKQAVLSLAVMRRKASVVILKVLRQALANAVHNHQLNQESLRIDNILVNQGTRYKRFNPVSRGRAHSIVKETTHVRLILTTNQKVADQKVEQDKIKTLSVGESLETTDDVTKSLTTKQETVKKVAVAKAVDAKAQKNADRKNVAVKITKSSKNNTKKKGQ